MFIIFVLSKKKNQKVNKYVRQGSVKQCPIFADLSFVNNLVTTIVLVKKKKVSDFNHFGSLSRIWYRTYHIFFIRLILSWIVKLQFLTRIQSLLCFVLSNFWAQVRHEYVPSQIQGIWKNYREFCALQGNKLVLTRNMVWSWMSSLV